jgi:hypothetical protein
MVLIMVGLVWALIGAGNIILGIHNINKAGMSEGWITASLLFNMILFVLPGLVVAGIGKMIGKNKRDEKASSGTKKCPRCAEDIKAEAQVCRFCGHCFTKGISPSIAEPASSTPKKENTEVRDLAADYINKMQSKGV